MKRKFLLGALLLAPCMLLAGCTMTPELSFTSNWYANTANDANLTGTREELVYDVTFTPDESSAFTAEFTGTYKTSLKEEMIQSEPGTPLGYCLRTELSLTGAYTVDGKKGDTFNDSVLSEVWFLRTSDRLRPIKNVRTVTYHAPDFRALDASMSSLYSYTYTADYNAALNEVLLSYDFRSPSAAEDRETRVRIGGAGTYLDDAEILFALRATSLSAALSFRSVNPVTSELKTVSAGRPQLLEEHKATFSVGGADASEHTLTAAQFTLAYTGDRSGRAQLLTYAACTDPSANTYRNVLLSAEGFMQSTLGTFRIDLKEAVFNNK